MPGRKCKICTSAYVKQVNDMLARNTPYSVIVSYLKDRNFSVSEMTVSRHKRKCLKNIKTNTVRVLKATRVKRDRDADGSKEAKRIDQVIQGSRIVAASSASTKAAQQSYLIHLKKMKEDIDILNELLYVLAVSKDRVERALAEEHATGLIMNTTATAIKNYEGALKDFHEITSGMDSLQKLRYVQLVQMINAILCSTTISDRTRYELLALMEDEDARKRMLEQITALDAKGAEETKDDRKRV